MMYRVTIVRQEHREHVFEVEADSMEEAEEKATEESYDHDFGQDKVHYAGQEVVLCRALDI